MSRYRRRRRRSRVARRVRHEAWEVVAWVLFWPILLPLWLLRRLL